MQENEETVKKIKEIIDHIKPYIQADGGDLEFKDYTDGIVTVNLVGACVGCSAIDITLNQGIRTWIMEEIPEVKDVVLEASAFEFEEGSYYGWGEPFDPENPDK